MYVFCLHEQNNRLLQMREHVTLTWRTCTEERILSPNRKTEISFRMDQNIAIDVFTGSIFLILSVLYSNGVHVNLAISKARFYILPRYLMPSYTPGSRSHHLAPKTFLSKHTTHKIVPLPFLSSSPSLVKFFCFSFAPRGPAPLSLAR